MSGPLGSARSLPRAHHGWFDQLLTIGAVIGVGVLLGIQFVTPDKRVLSVMAALIVFGMAWRVNTVMGIGVLLIALPFPRGTVFGNTNLALILLLLVIWLMRFSTRVDPMPRRTPIDAPIAALLIAYIVSFTNVKPDQVGYALTNFMYFVSTVLLYYLIVNNVRSTNDLRRFHVFQTVCAFAVFFTAGYELFHPGGALVPGWIEFAGKYTEGTEIHNLRVGGPFTDYELLAEFCILHVLLFTFLFRQARTPGGRTIFAGMFAFAFLVLLATVTRGAMIALAAGVFYLLFRIRRRLQVVPLTIMSAAVVAGLIGTEYFVSTFTHSGSVAERFAGTHMVGGMPDSRAVVWPQAIERMMKHPLIGSGPYYASLEGLRTWYWPHDLYLYVANIIGLIGLAFFLWLLWRLWQLTRPETDDLADSNYTRAFLLIARVQLVTFLVDQIKIEYLRHPIYQFEVWVMFSAFVAASQIRVREESEARTVRLASAA
jgi:O-antigen ligase